MRAFVVRGLGTLFVAGALIAGLSCARDQQLESIRIIPNTETLGVGCGGSGPTSCGPVTIYTALGTYIHPPVQKDITSQVLWQVDSPDIVQFADPTHPNYLYPTGLGCGTNLNVLAVVYRRPSDPSSGRAVVGTATVNVSCGGGSGSGGSDFTLSPSPATQTVAPGGNTSYTITVSTTASNAVALSVGNLPAGISATLVPNSVTGNGTATLNITTTGSVAPGSYAITITGDDLSGTQSVSVDLTVT
jgi:hypothetical protein